jgi:ArsR family metal-binding transcriptional regulator
MSIITTFPNIAEFEKAVRFGDDQKISYRVIHPGQAYALVGMPAIVIEENERDRFLGEGASRFSSSGWVDYHPSPVPVPSVAPPAFNEDKFGHAAIMVLRPCMADGKKLRITAHLSGDLTEVFPYMNAIDKHAFYNAKAHTFTIMDGQRFIALYQRRIGIAKTDDIIDTWRVLEWLRVRFNECWRDRAGIIPSDALRKRPPALEIYARLPKTNCGACGEGTCMAFAFRLWSGKGKIAECKPVFEGSEIRLKDALSEICGGLGV